MSTITIAELREGLEDSRRTVVDIRPLASYNGWRLDGEPRGGHIPGAVSFPATWLGTVDDAEIGRLLAEKRISPERDVVVYGDRSASAADFVAALARFGIDDARAYEDGLAAWAADPSLPLDRLPRYEALVHIPWLRAVLDGERP
jgi:molybdopterin synthase sulfurtransferase